MITIWGPVLLVAGWATADPGRIAKGREVYAAACAACHGADGKGNPEWENPVRPVEFTDCGTTAEPTELWETIVRRGGASRGLSSVMPAFGEAYTDEEIAAVVAYIRTLCDEADRYPPGDLNFRRLLSTGKAFPEVEVVLRAGHRPERAERETEVQLIYENRIGPRFQYELALPLRPQAAAGVGGTGIGDIEVEGKYVLHFDFRRAEILSAGLGVSFPSGKESEGLGEGTAVFAPFLAYGKAWGRTLLQSRVGAKLPSGWDRADPELTYAVGVSRALGSPRTAWTPAVELTGAYNTREETAQQALWVELSKPLNKLGHVIMAAGVRVPVRPAKETYRIEAYLLWDFGDGPFWVGW
jgi:mono/diheme cytochrome c family protein